MIATATPRRLHLSLAELRAAFQELVGRADLYVSREQLVDALEEAMAPYASLAEEQA